MRASLIEQHELARHGYTVARENGGWTLRDPDGDALLIGDHGCVAPTQAAAVCEGLIRVAQDHGLDVEPERCDPIAIALDLHHRDVIA